MLKQVISSLSVPSQQILWETVGRLMMMMINIYLFILSYFPFKHVHLFFFFAMDCMLEKAFTLSNVYSVCNIVSEN